MIHRVRQRHDVRQHQILEAVSKLIMTKGMHSVTIKDIAEEVDVSEGALYRHFVSKQQMFSFLVDQLQEFLSKMVQEVQQHEAPAVEKLDHILQAQLRDVEDYKGLALIVVAEAVAFEDAELRARIASLLTEYLESIQEILRLGIQEGSLRSDLNVDAAATTYFGLLHSTATMWAMNGYAPQLAEHRSQMWDIYRRGVMTRDS